MPSGPGTYGNTRGRPPAQRRPPAQKGKKGKKK